MTRFFRKKRGQNTAEYAILIALVIAAAVAMQTYVKRSLQGGVKFAVDKAGKPQGAGQYEPYYLESNYSKNVSAYKDTEQTKVGGEVERVYGADKKVKTVTSTGYQKIRSANEAD